MGNRSITNRDYQSRLVFVFDRNRNRYRYRPRPHSPSTVLLLANSFTRYLNVSLHREECFFFSLFFYCGGIRDRHISLFAFAEQLCIFPRVPNLDLCADPQGAKRKF